MSTVIDNRVVDMQFNNAQFEKGASQSISTLEKLKQSLQFNKETQSIGELQKSSDRFNLSGIADALSFTSNRFSLFEIAGITAFTNIVNKGVNLLESKIKDLTFGQAISGWNKYAEKTSAVQTIMAATASDFQDTGEQMDYVNGQLEKLNWFTDETSFNFLDMVNNIGKFTANKVPLDEAVTSMQGISTWAAISGANVGEAGRAMYNLSQAIAVGSVKLMDWKSIENANMATAEFKQTVIDTALELGTLEKQGDAVFVKGNKKAAVSVQNFNAELSRGWFSADVLKKALNKYGEFTNRLYEFSDATGLIASDILKIIDGYKDGSMSIKDIMNELGDTTLTAEEVQRMMDGLTDKTMELGEKAFRTAQEAKTFQEAMGSVADAVSTGWMQTFETIFGNYEQAKKVWTAVANELYDLFAEPGKKRNELLKEWSKKGGRDLFIDGVVNSWEAFRNVLDLVGESFRDVFPEKTADDFLNFTKTVDNLSKSFKNFFKVRDDIPSAKEFQSMLGDGRYTEAEIEHAREAIKQAGETQQRLNSIQSTLRGFFAAIHIVSKALGALGTIVSKFIGYLIPAADGVLSMTGSFGDWLVMLDKAIDEQGLFNKIISEVDPILQTVAGAIKKGVDAISNTLGTLANILGLTSNSVEDMTKKVDNAFSPIKAFVDIIKGVFAFLKGGVSAALPLLGKVFEVVKEKFNLLASAFKKGMASGSFSDLMNMIRTGMLGVFIAKITGAFDKLKTTIGTISDFKENVASMVEQVLKSLNPVQDVSQGTEFLKIAAGLAILAFSLTLLAGVDQKLLYSSIFAISLLAQIVTKVYSAIAQAKPKTFKDLEGVIVSFSKSVLGSIKSTISGVKWTVLATALIIVAGAVAVLAGSVVALASLGWDGLLKGLLGVVALIGILIATAFILTKMKGKIIEGTGALTALAGAVNMIAGVVVKLASIKDPEALMRGVGAVMLLIGAFTLFSKFSKDIKIASGISLIGVAASIVILAKAVESLSIIDGSSLMKSIVAIGALLTGLAGFMVVISKFAKGGTAIAGAIGVLVLSAAMVIMSKAVANFSVLDPDRLMNGITAIIAVMFAFAAMTKIMKGGFGNTMAILSLSVVLISLAESMKILAKIPVNAVNVAIIAISSVLTILALLTQITDVKGALGIGVMAVSLVALALAFKVMSTIPIEGMVGTFVAFAVALGMMAAAGALITPAMAANFISVGLSIIMFGAGILMASAGLLTFVTAISAAMGALKFLAQNIQVITVYAIQIVLGFINGIIIMMPQIVETAVYMILTFLYTIAVTISDNAPMIIQAVWVIIQAIWTVILEALAQVVEIIPGVGGGLAEKIRGWKPNIKQAADDALSQIPNAASDAMDDTEKIVDNGQSSMIDSLYSRAAQGKEAATAVTENTAVGFSGITDYAKQYGMEGVNTFATNITNGAPQAGEAGTKVKDAAVEGTDDVTAFENTGKNNAKGYVNGMLSKLPEVRSAGTALGRASLSATQHSIDSHSPSKKARKLGTNYTTGYIGGMLDRIRDVISAAKNIGRSSLDALSHSMSSAADIISQEIDLSPTITPVVDLGNVRSGVGSISSMFGSISDSLSPTDIISSGKYLRNSMSALDSIGRNIDATKINDVYNLDAMSDNTDIVEAIGSLKEDVSNLGVAMSNMQIIMDGREVAKATATYTRTELNRIDRLEGRKGGRI